jgi:hypothetical protein
VCYIAEKLVDGNVDLYLRFHRAIERFKLFVYEVGYSTDILNRCGNG